AHQSGRQVQGARDEGVGSGTGAWTKRATWSRGPPRRLLASLACAHPSIVASLQLLNCNGMLHEEVRLGWLSRSKREDRFAASLIMYVSRGERERLIDPVRSRQQGS